MSTFRNSRFLSSIVIAGLAIVSCSFGLTSRAEAPAKDAALSKQQARFAKLEQALTGAALVGHFTETGKQEINPRTERYELKTVKHVEEDRWLFEARITYGEHDVTVPLTLPVKWAGDTPVITVDNMGIPGLGLYTARVMIYADHYAGFWSGGDHGGHLFGVVERAKSD